MVKTNSIILTAILGLFWFQSAASGVYINSSFRDQSVYDGYFLHMARSFNGHLWTAFNDDEPLLMPAPGQGSAMRDTSILRGPDNRYHMVWTSTPTAFGYSSSPDLVHWTPQRLVPLSEQIPNAQNTWAPELFYDEGRSEYLILWSVSDDGLDEHRIYSTTTTDFETFTPTQKFFDPGYSVIDAAIIQNGSQYTMFFKDERDSRKRLKMVTANDITPGAFAGQPIYDLNARVGKYVEGPCAYQNGRLLLRLLRPLYGLLRYLYVHLLSPILWRLAVERSGELDRRFRPNVVSGRHPARLCV